jgi:hypothetical protein
VKGRSLSRVDRSIVLVGVLLAPGCNTTPVVVDQPFVLGESQESGTESESAVEAQVTAVLNDELPPPVLVTWTPAPVVLQPPHLSTAAGRAPPSIVFGPGSEADYDRVLRDPSLVELHGDHRIDIRLIPQEQVHGDTLRTLLVEPAEGWVDGWYELRVNVTGRIGGAVRGSDGWAVSRFRPDSYPVVQGVWAAERDGRRVIEAHLSEHVVIDDAASAWRLWDDMGELACATRSEPGSTTDRFIWSCDRAEVGTLHIDFGTVLTTTLGDVLRTQGGEALTALHLVATGRPDAAGVVTLE